MFIFTSTHGDLWLACHVVVGVVVVDVGVLSVLGGKVVN